MKTLIEFINDNQSDFPYATGEFTRLLNDIGIAAKIVNREVNKAGLTNILGAQGQTNVQGESQQKLDVFANDHFINALRSGGQVCAIASEEPAVSARTIKGITKRSSSSEACSVAAAFDATAAGRALSASRLFLYARNGAPTAGSSSKPTSWTGMEKDASRSVVPLVLQVIQELEDQFGLDVDQPQGGGRLDQFAAGEVQEQHQRIAVAGHRARADCALRDEILGEELLNQ